MSTDIYKHAQRSDGKHQQLMASFNTQRVHGNINLITQLNATSGTYAVSDVVPIITFISFMVNIKWIDSVSVT